MPNATNANEWVEVPVSKEDEWKEVPVEQSSKDIAFEKAYKGKNPFDVSTDAFKRGLANGATFGFSDEAAGVINSKLKNSDYVTERDLYRAEDELAKQVQPHAYRVGQAMGTVATTAVPGVGIAGKTAGIGKIALQGAIQGGITGLGESEADLTKGDIEGAAVDTGVGALAGAGISGVVGSVPGAIQLAKDVVPSIRNYAERKAVKAAGAMTKDFNKISIKGKQFSDKQAINTMGRELLDKEVVTIGASLNDIADRLAAQKEITGHKIGEIVNKVDDLRNTAKTTVESSPMYQNLTGEQKQVVKNGIDENFGISMQRIGDRIQNEIVNPVRQNPILEETVLNEVNKMESMAERFRNKPIRSTSISAGLIAKGKQREIANFGSETIPKQFQQEFYKILKSEIDDSVGRTGNIEQFIERSTSGKPLPKMENEEVSQMIPRGMNPVSTQLQQQYQAINKEYAILANAEKITQERLGKSEANRQISLSDIIAGTAGLVSGGPVKAIVLGSASKMIRKYGSSFSAVTADGLSDFLERNANKLGPKAAPLLNAARQGAVPLVITHYELTNSDPNFDKLLDVVYREDQREQIRNDESIDPVIKAKMLSEINSKK